MSRFGLDALRLWPRPRVLISLAPRAVEMTAVSWRGAGRRRERGECGEHAAGAPAWAPPLAVLQAMLRGGTWGAARATFVLSDRLVRHALIPADLGIHRAGEQLAYVRHLYRADFGAAVDEWRIVVDTDGAGTGFACAIDAGLYSGLRRACAEAGLELASLVPRCAAAQARWSRRLPRRPLWFVAVEAGQATAALFDGRTWREVLAARCTDAAEMPSTELICDALRQHALGRQAMQTVRSLWVAGPAAAVSQMRFPGTWDAHLLADALPGGA